MKYSIIALACIVMAGCGSTSSTQSGVTLAQEVSNKKAEINNCLKGTKENGEDCVAKSTKNKLGLRCTNKMVTGTRITRRVCTTAAQRELIAKEGRDTANGIQRSRRAMPNGEQIRHNGF